MVIDGGAVPSLLDEMCRVAAPAGRTWLLGFSAEPTLLVQQVVVSKELSLFGSCLNRRLMPQVVEWLESGALQPEAMVTQSYPAIEARAAFDFAEKQPGQVLKVQLELN
jgi:L-gulonate 5-dehydrogenase